MWSFGNFIALLGEGVSKYFSKKSGRNIRQYTKEDIDEIRLIYNLVKVKGLKLSAAREVLKKNKEGVSRTVDVVDRLKEIRRELLQLKKALDGLV